LHNHISEARARELEEKLLIKFHSIQPMPRLALLLLNRKLLLTFGPPVHLWAC